MMLFVGLEAANQVLCSWEAASCHVTFIYEGFADKLWKASLNVELCCKLSMQESGS